MRARRLSWLLADVLRRGQRWGTLLTTLVVASAGFAILTAQSITTRLDVVGTVNANARAAYDILVRPKDTRTEVEKTLNLVQPGFLSAYPTGITMEAWRGIQGIAGVQVAAPVAVVGWTIQQQWVNVAPPASFVAGIKEPTLVKLSSRFAYDNGASVIEAAQWFYLTPNPTIFRPGDQGLGPAAWLETMPDGTVVTHLVPSLSQRGNHPEVVPIVKGAVDPRSFSVAVSFPYLLAAVDPASEAALAGLDKAVVSGSYLEPGTPTVGTYYHLPGVGDLTAVGVPVLVASAPGVEMTVSSALSDQGPAAEGGHGGSGATLATDETSASDSYQTLVSSMVTEGGPLVSMSASDGRLLIRTGATSVTSEAAGGMRATAVGQDQGVWPVDAYGGRQLPFAWDDALMRSRAVYGFWPSGESDQGIALVKRGVFDAQRLSDTGLGRLPLGTYDFDAPTGADARSRATLGDRPWQPAMPWGYVQAPPLMLTTLDSLPVFAAGWSKTTPTEDMVAEAPVGKAPLSAIRVRVAGVESFDAVAREKVRLVAEDIARTTGLTVDIVMGSSPAPQRLTVDAGTHGRPELTIDQRWVKKGVAVALIAAADRKSLLLNVGILAISGVVVNNAVFAQVRSRRREIGLLRASGWTSWQVFGWILGAVTFVSLVAGAIGAAVAALIRIFGLQFDWRQVAWAFPAALGVGVLAALAPAAQASRLSPLEAVAPAGARRSRGRLRPVAGLPGMSLRGITAAPGRAALAVASLATATAAMGVLWTIQAEFRGRAVGTLLGDAITMQVSGPDLAAAVAMFVLAGVGVTHALSIEVRERAGEFATLRASGWRESMLVGSLMGQALVVGLLGGLLGAAGALAFAATVLAASSPQILALALSAGAASVLVALFATVVPAWLLRRVPTAALLAED